jgi:hypothetical protein
MPASVGVRMISAPRTFMTDVFAASIMPMAARSLTLPPGFRNSSFAWSDAPSGGP